MKIKIVDDDEYYTFDRHTFYALITGVSIVLTALLYSIQNHVAHSIPIQQLPKENICYLR